MLKCLSDIHGSEKTLWIDRDVSSVILNDFPDEVNSFKQYFSTPGY